MVALIILALTIACVRPPAVHAATLTVNSTGDGTDVSAGNGICETATGNGVCTLRAAIQEANALTGRDTIDFAISGVGSHTIIVAADLPVITSPVVIDGTTQPGSACGNLWGGIAPTWKIVIQGNGTRTYGLELNTGSDGSTIKGLSITGFTRLSPGNAFAISGQSSDRMVIVCNSLSGNAAGVNVRGANVAIGGRSAGDGNLIGNNTVDGVFLSVTARGTAVVGNFVGVNAAGTAAASNEDALYIEGAATTTITHNLLSGSTHWGIDINAGSTGVIIQGNLIGTNAAGTAAIGNQGGGILVIGDGTFIGGTSASARNIISGNAKGISISPAISATTIQGNYIGTNAAGTAAIGNTQPGIINNGTGTTIGGTVSGAGNVISGNARDGIHVSTTAAATTVQGNYIGTNAAGTAAIGNAGHGISNNGTGTTIGGTVSGAGNVISGSTGGFNAGINLSSTGATVQGNSIGTDATGTAALPNVVGILITAANNAVGGTTASARNIISGNTHGIVIVDAGGSPANNVIQGNAIGVAADGTPLGNTAYGVVLVGAGTTNTTIGGTASGAGNVVANSGSAGISTYDFSVFALGPAGIGNAFLGNSIYSNGSLGIDLTSARSPTVSEGITGNDTGDPDTGPNNLQNFPVISAATTDGATTTITGTLNSTASATFRIEFFANPTAASSGSGEGHTYLGTTSVTTDDAGNAAFTATGLTATTVGYAISATASKDEDSSHFSTSELAPSVDVTATASADLGKKDGALAGHLATEEKSGRAAAEEGEPRK